MTIILREMTRAMPSSFHLNNGRARIISSRANHLALKTIPLFSKYYNRVGGPLSRGEIVSSNSQMPGER